MKRKHTKRMSQVHFSIDVHIHLHNDTTLQQLPAVAAPTTMLRSAAEAFLQRVAPSRSSSTMSNYTTAVRSFGAYLKHDICLGEITTDLLGGYERWLRSRGICPNTTSCYMRSLRAVLAGCDERLKSIFSTVYTGKAATVKRSVPTEVIGRLQRLSLPPGTFLYLARDVFLFSFYAMGMPFVDVAHLQWSQVVGDTIVYYRQKTGQRVVVALEPVMRQLIDTYRKRSASYVFPLLSTGTDHEYLMLLGRYNRALHRLEQLAQLDVKLTSYVVRHTWASTAYRSNVELAVISKALGHTNPQTTLTYIRELDDARLAEANRRIINQLDIEK